MQHFSHEDEIFEFLYSVSVGMERLLKISIVLVEHDETTNQKEFENSLKTHNHQKLVDRLQKQHDLGLSSVQNAFIQLLVEFYNTHRYDRFRLDSIHNYGKEKEELRSFLATHLEVEIKEDTIVIGTVNNQKIRSRMAELISGMARKIYRIISDEASRINIYIDELRSDSKSGILFRTPERTDFSIGDRALAEFLIFIVNASERKGLLEFIREIKPLDLDPAMAVDFIQSLNSYVERSFLADTIEAVYDDLKETEDLEETENFEERKATLDFLLSHDFSDSFDEEESDDNW